MTTVSHGSKRHRLTRGHRSTAKEANKTNKYIRRHRREKGNFIKVYDSDITKKYILREDRKMLVHGLLVSVAVDIVIPLKRRPKQMKFSV